MAVCSFMGLPWYVAATVISIAHIDSLKMESESSAPGEQPQFLGVRYGRSPPATAPIGLEIECDRVFTGNRG